MKVPALKVWLVRKKMSVKREERQEAVYTTLGQITGVDQEDS